MEYKFVKTRKVHSCHGSGCRQKLPSERLHEPGEMMFRVTYFGIKKKKKNKGRYSSGQTDPKHEYYCEECALSRFRTFIEGDVFEEAADAAYDAALEKKRAGEKVPRWWNKMLSTEEMKGILDGLKMDFKRDVVEYLGDDWEKEFRSACNEGGSKLIDWDRGERL